LAAIVIAFAATQEVAPLARFEPQDVAANAIVTSIHVSASGMVPFLSWQSTLTRLVSSQPDFLSVEILPTHQGSAQWQIIQRFTRPEALERWLGLPLRQALMDELLPLKAPDGSGMREDIAPDYHALGGVTEVITTIVESGREAEFLAWTEAIQAAQSRFPGYMGSFVHAPVAGHSPHWATLVRFATPAQLDAWLGSSERRALLDRADPTMSRWSSRRLAGGFGSWFGPNETGAAPPAWKQTAIVLLVLFPVVILEMRFLSPHLAGLPTTLGTFIGNAVSVCLVSWPLAGLAGAAMAWWLKPPAAHRQRNEIGGAAVMTALYAAEIGLLSLLF
jgi:antibiotic biosynthesis monooxygenase (ABM) superfamily enzyme